MALLNETFFFFRFRCVYGKSLRFGITPDLRRLSFFC
nr:MAG TPA: hypothetical protein [Caudoviricetes sp.]